MPHASFVRTWLVLLCITAITYWVGEGGLAGQAAIVPVLLVVILALVKGLLVCLDFLELRHAPAMWRWLVMGWLVAVLSLIVLAYAMSLR